MTVINIVLFFVRIVIGGFFVFAAVPKLMDPLAFATSISHYHLLPVWSINAYALIIPWLEILAGVAMILGFKTRTAAIITGLLLLMFTIAVAIAVVQGLQIDCGCFGEQGGEEVSWLKVAKNTAMILGCAALVWHPTSLFSLDEKISKPV